MMEFFDAARHARHIAYRILCSASFFIVLTGASTMHFGPMQRNDERNTAECWKPSMRFGTHSLPQVHASYLCIVRAKPSDMHRDPRSAGRNATLKELDARSGV